MSSAKNLATNAALVGSSINTAIQWPGGRTAFILEASAFGTGVFLQMKSPSGQGINVNGTTYSANQITIYDLPAGSYALVNQGSSSIGVYAVLVTVPYDN